MSQHLSRLVSRISSGLARSAADGTAADAYAAVQSAARELAAGETLAEAVRGGDAGRIGEALASWDEARKDTVGR